MYSILEILFLITFFNVSFIKCYENNLFCKNELMTYSNASKSFDCIHVERLRHLGLSNGHEIKEPILHKLYGSPLKSDAPTFNFVMASNEKFYKHVRATIASIQKHFNNYRIFLFDLGGLAGNADIEMFEALKPEDFIWTDGSMFFKSNDFGPFFDLMGEGTEPNYQLIPFQMINHCCRIRESFMPTHPSMLNYINPQPTVLNSRMLEAGLVLVRRTETTRQLLKWAVLCAITKDCIEPDNYKVGCPWETEHPKYAPPPEGICHLQDQSLMNILAMNLEIELEKAGKKNLNKLTTEEYPREPNRLHETRRKHVTNETIAHCTQVKTNPTVKTTSKIRKTSSTMSSLNRTASTTKQQENNTEVTTLLKNKTNVCNDAKTFASFYLFVLIIFVFTKIFA